MRAWSSSAPAPTGTSCRARKGIIDARVTVHGRAAHAGVEPEKGRNAILEASRIVRDLHDLNGRWPGVTVNVGVIRGGTRPNVVAERCELEVDLRATTGDDLDAAEAAVREVARRHDVPDVTTELEVMAGWRPMEKLARSGRLVEHAQAVARDLGFEIADAATGGASDANTTSGMGVPTLDGLGPIGGNDHSPAEYLEVDSIVPRTSLVAGLLLAIAHDPDVLGVARGRPAVRRVVTGDDGRRRITSGGPWEAAYGYSRAIVVGDACWVAGTTDAGPGRALAASGRRRGPGEGGLRDHRARARRGRVLAGRRRPDADVRHRSRRCRRGRVASTARSSAPSVRPRRWSRSPACSSRACSSRSRSTPGADPARTRGPGTARRATGRRRRSRRPTTIPRNRLRRHSTTPEAGEHRDPFDADLDVRLCRRRSVMTITLTAAIAVRTAGPDELQVVEDGRGSRSIPGASRPTARDG